MRNLIILFVDYTVQSLFDLFIDLFSRKNSLASTQEQKQEYMYNIEFSRQFHENSNFISRLMACLSLARSH